MQIVVNGESYDAPDQASVAMLVDGLRLQGQRLAIELNGDIVPRGEWAGRRIAASDRIEIVRAIGGG